MFEIEDWQRCWYGQLSAVEQRAITSRRRRMELSNESQDGSGAFVVRGCCLQFMRDVSHFSGDQGWNMGDDIGKGVYAVTLREAKETGRLEALQ